ncbi:hypothetical protein NONI108955_37865 [Nocardia ninae]
MGLGISRRGDAVPASGVQVCDLALEFGEVVAQEPGESRQPCYELIEVIEIDVEFVGHRFRLDVRDAAAVS